LFFKKPHSKCNHCEIIFEANPSEAVFNNPPLIAGEGRGEVSISKMQSLRFFLRSNLPLVILNAPLKQLPLKDLPTSKQQDSSRVKSEGDNQNEAQASPRLSGEGGAYQFTFFINILTIRFLTRQFGRLTLKVKVEQN